MNYDPMTPIWLQVATSLKEDIATGKLAPGEKLPGGRDLAVRYTINPNTAARVYQEMEKEGLCATRRGLGTFVTEDAGRIAQLRREMARAAADELTRRLHRLGFETDDIIRLLTEKEEL